MSIFINWLSTNESWLAIIISAISTVLTFILTLIIICQTKKLNEKQQQLDQLINQQQENLQKRQLKLDIYPYKREVYVNVFSVLSLCNFLSKNFTEELLIRKSSEDIEKMFKVLQSNYVPDTQKTLWSLREAEYIFSKETAEIILDIRSNFDIMSSRVLVPNAVETVLKDTGINYQTMMEKIKQKNIHRALECSKKILSYTDYIEKKLPQELRIVDVDK